MHMGQRFAFGKIKSPARVFIVSRRIWPVSQSLVMESGGYLTRPKEKGGKQNETASGITFFFFFGKKMSFAPHEPLCFHSCPCILEVTLEGHGFKGTQTCNTSSIHTFILGFVRNWT